MDGQKCKNLAAEDMRRLLTLLCQRQACTQARRYKDLYRPSLNSLCTEVSEGQFTLTKIAKAATIHIVLPQMLIVKSFLSEDLIQL